MATQLHTRELAVQTTPRLKNWKWSRLLIWVSGLIRIQTWIDCLVGVSHFAKLVKIGQWLRRGNKFPKMHHSTVVKKWKSDAESTCGYETPPKLITSTGLINPCLCLPRFGWRPFLRSRDPAHWMTDRTIALLYQPWRSDNRIFTNCKYYYKIRSLRTSDIYWTKTKNYRTKIIGIS